MFGLLISIGLIWLIIEKYDFESTWKIVRETPISFLVIMMAIYLSTFIFRTIRFKLMLIDFPEFRFRHILKSLILGFAGNNIIPARGGELLRMEYINRETNISRTTALTSIGLEKVLDAVVLLSFLLAAGIFFLKTNEYFIYIIKVISLVFIPTITFLIASRIWGGQIIKWLGLRNGKFFKFFSKQFMNFYAALSFLKADINTLQILVISIFIWFLEGLVFVLGLKAIGLGSSLMLMGIVALCIVNFGILIPSSPGYIGLFQAAFIVALASFHIPETDSLAAGIIIHSCQFFPITLLGMIIMAHEYYKFNKQVISRKTINMHLK
jgi:uncharacterized protein (TIRG00374 family)